MTPTEISKTKIKKPSLGEIWAFHSPDRGPSFYLVVSKPKKVRSTLQNQWVFDGLTLSDDFNDKLAGTTFPRAIAYYNQQYWEKVS